MKPLLIALSLLANAALIAAFALKPALVPPAVRDFFGGSSPTAGNSSRAAPTATHGRPAEKLPPQLWSALQRDDLPSLIDRLRAAGFPPNIIRADETLSPDAREAQIKQLAARGRDELTATLGSVVAGTYTPTASWLRYLSGGSAFTVDPKERYVISGLNLIAYPLSVPRPRAPASKP